MSGDKSHIPEGFALVAVKGFDDLMYWLDRCDSKGHLERCTDLIEPWAAFEYRAIASAPDLLIERDKLKAANAELAGALEMLLTKLDLYAGVSIREYGFPAVITVSRAALEKHNKGDSHAN